MNRIFLAIGLVLASMATVQATCEKRELKIRFAVKNMVADTMEYRLAKEVQTQFQRVLNGAVCVDIFVAEDLNEDVFPLDLLSTGIADLVAPKTSQLGIALPEFRVLNLPFAFKNYSAVWRFMNPQRILKLSSLVEGVGVRSFGFALTGFEQIGAKIPLLTPQLGTGLKFRLSDNTSGRAILAPLKATAITVNDADLAAAVKNGRVDAQVDDWVSMEANKSSKEHAAIVETNHRLKAAWVVGAMAWKISLTKALQSRVNEAIITGVKQFNVRERNNQLLAKRAIMQRGQPVYALTHLQRSVWLKAFEPEWNAVFSNENSAPIRTNLLNSSR